MPERYSISSASETLAKRFGVESPASFQAQYNAAPTQLLPVITDSGKQGFSFFYWGAVPELAQNKSLSAKIYTARTEDLISKGAFRKSIRLNRCLIPLDGFYCWKTIGKKTQIPYRVMPSNNDLLAAAGIWEEFETMDGEVVHTFSMITSLAAPGLTSLCERMPLILTKENENKWLNTDLNPLEIETILSQAAKVEWTNFTVSPKLSQINYNSPLLLKPEPPADKLGNYTLFS